MPQSRTKRALDANEKLIIPATQPPSETNAVWLAIACAWRHVPRIADRYNVSADDLRKWNRLKANRVSRGMVLRIYALGGTPKVPARARSKSKKKPRNLPRADQWPQSQLSLSYDYL